MMQDIGSAREPWENTRLPRNAADKPRDITMSGITICVRSASDIGKRVSGAA